MEFVGKRSPVMEFLEKSSPGMEFVGKRAPGMEFVGKRSPGMDFVSKRIGVWSLESPAPSKQKSTRKVVFADTGPP